MAVKVGHFSKSTNTSVPVEQAVTGVGFKPWAVLMFTAGQTSADSFVADFRAGVGMACRNSSDTITMGAYAFASQDGQASSNASEGRNITALRLVEWGESLIAECSVTSFDSDGFTLSWTTNNASAYIIHYIAIGGANVTDAAIVDWAFNTSTGNQAITGVGFQPDCVIHLNNACTAEAEVVSNGRFTIGAMTTTGQIVCSANTYDNIATMNSRCHMASNRTMYMPLSTGPVYMYATYVSMDADGFTVNIDDAPAAAHRNLSLCLKGGSYYAGTFTGSASTGSQAVTGVGFQPEGILWLTNSNQLNNAATSGQDDVALGISATDGTGEEGIIVTDQDGTADSNTAGYSSSSKILLHDEGAEQNLTQAADITSLDADGFTVNWTTAGATNRAYVYIAMAGGTAGSGGGATTTIPPIAMNYFARRGILG